MEELQAKLVEVIELYEKKIKDSEAKDWQDQGEYSAREAEYSAREAFRYVIMGLRLALGWVEEYS